MRAARGGVRSSMLDAVALLLAAIAAGPQAWLAAPPPSAWGRTLAPSYLAEPDAQTCRAWSLAHPAPPSVSRELASLWPNADAGGDMAPVRCAWSVYGEHAPDGPDCARAAQLTSSPAARRWYQEAAAVCDAP